MKSLIAIELYIFEFEYYYYRINYYRIALELEEASTEILTSVLGLKTSGGKPDRLLEDEWLLVAPIERGGGSTFGVGKA